MSNYHYMWRKPERIDRYSVTVNSLAIMRRTTCWISNAATNGFFCCIYCRLVFCRFHWCSQCPKFVLIFVVQRLILMMPISNCFIEDFWNRIRICSVIYPINDGVGNSKLCLVYLSTSISKYNTCYTVYIRVITVIR